MISPDESILICAVRYALGRMSYIVGEVANYVFFKWKDTIQSDKHLEWNAMKEHGKIYWKF